MRPIPAALVTGVLIVLGKWARNQSPNIDNAVGVVGIAVILALIEQANEKLSRAFAVLIVVSVAAVHLTTIVKAAGFGKK
jgi:hypothetical protein